MSISANIPDRVKTELNLAIAEVVRTYQNENDRYFSRNRILDVETMLKLLISMQGGSLQKELHEAGISATASDFVKQEIFAAMIMSNFCSRIAGQVVVEKPKKNIHANKVNWNMAVYLCKKFYREENGNGKQLMKDIAKYTEAVHPNRSDERNLKVKAFVGFTYRVSA